MLTGFRNFITRGNVVELAVAVVIGAIIGEPDFSGLTFTINGSEFTYGNFINALIAFLSIAAAVYFFVIVPLEKLDELRHGPKEAGTRECPECISEIPFSATRCAFCTTELPPADPSPASAS